MIESNTDGRKAKRGKPLAAFLVMAFLAVFLLVPPPALAAEEDAQPGISLSQAIDMATGQSESIKKAKHEIEKQKDWRDYRVDKLDFTPGAPGTAAEEVPYAQYLSTDLEWRMSKKSLTGAEDKVVLDTCSNYWSIIKLQEDEKAARKAAEYARQELQNARAGYQVGNLADAGLTAAETNYQAACSSLATVQNDLNAAYVKFNQSVGLGADERPALSEGIVYSPLEVDNLQQEVANVLVNSPDMYQAEALVEIQKAVKNLTLYSGEYKPYEARKIEVDQAKLDAASAKKLYEQTTRTLYYNILIIEDNYEKVQQSIKLAEKNLEVKKAMYDVGMATAAEVSAQEKTLAEAQAGAYALAYQHEYMKLAFKKPWAASL